MGSKKSCIVIDRASLVDALPKSGTEYELDSGYEKKIYAEPAYQFCLCYKPDVPIVGGRRVSEWAVTKDGKTIYEYDIVNDIWVEGSVYGFGDFSQTA